MSQSASAVAPADKNLRTAFLYLLSSKFKALLDYRFAPGERIGRVKLTLTLGFIAGLAFSPRLWLTRRHFPLIPLIHGVSPLPFPWDRVCFGVMLLLLALAFLKVQSRIYVLSFLLLLAMYSLFDQTRWQPWAYQYFFLLAGIACFSWKQGDVRGEQSALNIGRLVLAATYFYSGLQKMNPRFAQVGFPQLLGRIGTYLPALHVWGWVAASLEVCIGLGLLTRKFRKPAVVCGVLMHLFILYASGPVGLNWNSVIWPWNLVMITLLPLLFWNTDVSPGELLWRNQFALQKIVLVLFCVMPFFSFFGWWDSYLSASLYSANVTLANVIVSPAVAAQLPAEVRKYVKTLPNGVTVLKIQDWAFGELNVPPYAETRDYLKIGAEVCRYAQDSPDIVLLVQRRNTLLGSGRLERYTCFGTLGVLR